MNITLEQRARQVAKIEEWLGLYHPQPGAVLEVRALDVAGRRAASLCGTPAEMAVKAAEASGLGARGVYFTLNPLRPEMRGATVSAKAGDVVVRHWLPVDSDPVREAGANATEDEKQASWEVLCSARALLEGAGLTRFVVSDSGNGYHLCVPILLPCNHAAQELIKAALRGMSERCSTAAAKVDTAVHDAPRIWKVPGTAVRKGPETDGRPWRFSWLIEGQPWDKATAEANTAALQVLVQTFRQVADLRRGRPGDASVRTPLERARAYVAKIPPAVSGQGGHNQTFDVAQILVRGFSLPREDAWALLQEYNARCQPPWSEHELTHKLDSAIAESKLPQGYLLGVTPTPAGSNGAATAGTSRIPAEAIGSIQRPKKTVEPFPQQVLPPALNRFCEEGAKSLTCPVDYFAVPMLVAAAAAAGASRALQLTSDWWVFPSLYACVVAPPGAAKSPAAGRTIKPVRSQQAVNYLAWREAKKAWNLKSEEERGDQDPPKFQRSYTTNTTVEKLAGLLHDGLRGLLLHKDELIAWVSSFNVYREGRGEDEQTYMSIWDHQPFSIERKSNEDGLPISVHRPCLSVFGTTQPDVLGGLVRGSQNGFIERILFSYPDGGDRRRVWTWDGISDDARMAWEMVLRRLYALDWATPPMGEADSPEGTVWPKFAKFDQEGRLAWENFYGAHQDTREDLPDAMRACHAKMESYAARLTLLIALLSMAEVDSCTPDRVPVVSKGAVECAALLVRYFMSHACKVYGCLEETAEDKRIDRVVAWIKGRGGVVTLRDLVQYKVGGVKCVSEAELLLKKLVDRCLGTVTREPASNGRVTVTFLLISGE
jgi:hypothetical protein